MTDQPSRAACASSSSRPRRGATATRARASASSRSPAARATSSSASTTPPRSHRLTGTAGAVALHFPWDAVDDYGALREHIEARGLRVGAVNPNLFQDPDYKLGSITHPDARVREKAVAHLLECLEIATALGSTAQSLWLADGTNYPGQDDLRERRRRLLDALERVYAELPADQELLVEYKLFEPAFYATDLADWGSALLDVPEARRARAGARRPRPPRAGRQHRADRRACWPTRAGSAASTSTTASTPTTT